MQRSCHTTRRGHVHSRDQESDQVTLPCPPLEWEEEVEATAGVPGPLHVLSCKPERKKTRRNQGARIE